MSFLLTSFFAVLVSSMLDFLSLPLCWVSSCSASTVGDFAELGFCCAWSLPSGGCTEVVLARLNPSYSTVDVGGVCNFLGSVSSQQKFEVTDVKALCVSQLSDRSVLQLRVTAQFYLENKGKYILKT